jgi:hypothetical protein
MIWAVLVFVGVPLWLCALGIVALLYPPERNARGPEGAAPQG